MPDFDPIERLESQIAALEKQRQEVKKGLDQEKDNFRKLKAQGELAKIDAEIILLQTNLNKAKSK